MEEKHKFVYKNTIILSILILSAAAIIVSNNLTNFRISVDDDTKELLMNRSFCLIVEQYDNYSILFSGNCEYYDNEFYNKNETHQTGLGVDLE